MHWKLYTYTLHFSWEKSSLGNKENGKEAVKSFQTNSILHRPWVLNLNLIKSSEKMAVWDLFRLAYIMSNKGTGVTN